MKNNRYINFSSLRFQLFISMFIILVMFIAAKFIIDYKNNEKQILNYLVNTNKTINTFLAQNIREYIYTNDFEAIKNIVDSIANPYIKNILILNSQGKVIYSKLKEKQVGENYSLDFLTNRNNFLFYSSFEFLDVNIGYQVIEANSKQYEKEFLLQIKELFLFSCISSFFGLILSLILSTYISKPINQIISKLSKSNKNSYIEFDKQKIDEFEFLAQTVQFQRNELIELNKNLSKKIKEEVEKSQAIEKKLFESEKLAAMGEMIGNISHQWRQPLSVISTIASGIIVNHKFNMLNLDNLDSDMNDVVLQTKYLSNTIDDFRNFIKNSNVESTFTINHLLDKLTSLTSSVLKNYNIILVKNIYDNFELKSCENELIQALMNIINNSKDAIISNDELALRYIFITSKYLENKKQLIIYDNGGGIKEKIINKIFEPYFSTKHQSLGTGIGLHMTYNILVLKHEGTIEVSNYKYTYINNDYVGAKFIITFNEKKES
jgi:signal transduction histidine kinase